MPDATDDLIHGYLDGQLGPAELAHLDYQLARDPEFARRFALMALLHDRLRDRYRLPAGVVGGGPAAPSSPEAGTEPTRRIRRPLALTLAGLVILATILILVRGPGDRPVSAAEATLVRLIAAQARAGDRTYRVVALDGTPTAGGLPGRNRPSIDGALLHVRGEAQYVLVRLPGEPGEFRTGSDGRLAWSIPPEGPVRVSSDATRFRGAVPGEQQGLPFLDLGSALDRLRHAYDLQLLEGPETRLVARKRSAAHRGPRDVAIWFEPDTGIILRLRLDGLPMAQGGPRSVVLELIDQRDLGPAFFTHAAHHAPERRVLQDPP